MDELTTSRNLIMIFNLFFLGKLYRKIKKLDLAEKELNTAKRKKIKKKY